MKKQVSLFLFGLLICALINACKKGSDPAPDAGTQVAGTYTLTNFKLDSAGTTIYTSPLPLQDLSGTIIARRDSATVVYVTLTIKQTGQSDNPTVLGQLKLSGSTIPYDLYYGSTKVGNTDGKTFTLDYSYTEGGTLYHQVFNSQKQ